jgi:hemolysin III
VPSVTILAAKDFGYPGGARSATSPGRDVRPQQTKAGAHPGSPQIERLPCSQRRTQLKVVDGAPRLRGVFHLRAFYVAVPLGLVLALEAPTPLARIAAIAFALSVAAMFGTSSLFHRIPWSPGAKRRMAVLDHAMIYALIAGTYTPFALLVLRPGWRIPILAVVYAGSAAAIVAKVIWREAPSWVAAATCLTLGWIAVLVFPQIAARIGVGGTSLLAAGGVAYTVGAVVYARRRPDPFPATFGYHEIFHALVIVAVACQYAAIAFFVLPRA